MTKQERIVYKRRLVAARNNVQSQLHNKENEKRQYEQKSHDITAIVSKLNGIKGKIAEKSAKAKKMASIPNAGFTGYLYNSVYLLNLNSITSGYQSAVSGINSNVELLNKKKIEFDKKIKACEQSIRNLKARIRSLNAQIAAL